MTLEASLAAIQACVNCERLEYLQLCQTKNIDTEDLLGLTQQSILRILISHTDGSDAQIYELIDNYCTSLDFRRNMINQMIHELKSQRDDSLSYTFNDTTHKLKYANTGVNHLIHFNQIIKTLDCSNMIVFSNMHGFAVFPIDHYRDFEPDKKLINLNNNCYASVGAMIFHGFNLKQYPNVYFLQRLSIKIYAYTVFWLWSHLKNIALLQTSWWQQVLYQELAEMTGFHCKEGFEQAFHHIFYAHELGHDYAHTNNSRILNFLHQVGLNDEDLYFPDFPEEADLLAWHRIKAQVGTKRDICFLFGDLLANLSICNLNSLERRLIRIFHWSIISPPSVSNRPRGNILYLYYSAQQDLQPLFLDLTHIFTLLSANADTATALQKLEFDAWTRLQNQYAKKLKQTA